MSRCKFCGCERSRKPASAFGVTMFQCGTIHRSAHETNRINNRPAWQQSVPCEIISADRAAIAWAYRSGQGDENIPEECREALRISWLNKCPWIEEVVDAVH